MPDPTEKQFVSPGRALTHRLAWIILPLLVVGCSGGGSESPSAVSREAPPPAQATVLWRRADGQHPTLFRSQTDGSGLVMLIDAPGFDPVNAVSIFLSGATVVYHLTAPPLPPTQFGLTDIWQVQTNGTGRQAVVATTDAEIIRDVFGPWVIYEHVVYQNGTLFSSAYRSARLDGPAQWPVTDVNALYRLQLNGRAVFERVAQIAGGIQGDGNLFSVLPDGTDLRPLTAIPGGANGMYRFINPQGKVGSQVIFSVYTTPPVITGPFIPDLFAVPVTGGAVTPLVEGPDYKALGAVIGSRVVYHRCAIIPNPNPDPDAGEFTAGPCDLYSVRSDGSGTVGLSTHPWNDMVQGVVGTRVIVRRSLSGPTDELYSIRADGQGGETAMLTLSYLNDFVLGVVGERVVLRLGASLWSIRADGTGLVQLTFDVPETTFQVLAAGGWACFDRTVSGQQDLWCVPADGSGPAQPVATTDADEYFVTSF